MNSNEVILCRNVDEIISAFKDCTQCIKSFRKVNGITIECECKSEKLKASAKNEIQAYSKKFGVTPYDIQDSRIDELMVAVQYPELMPYYNEEVTRKMYRDNFKFLLDNIKMKDPKSVTKSMLYENMDSITKHSITIFCKSNINIYKDNVDNYLNDKKYRLKINTIFIEFVDDYINGEVK